MSRIEERAAAFGSVSRFGLPKRVLHIDAHMLVLDKPAGLAVHPGPQTPDSLERYLGELCFGFQRLPQPAHRLDRDTSGCLLLARNPKALKRLTQMFEAGQIAKTYWAVVAVAPAGDEGMIDAPLRKISSAAEGWRMIADAAKGKPARTGWRVLERRGAQALVEFRPETGRTHQIRVHAAHAGMPILGDPVYGAAARSGPAGPMQLHSRGLAVPFRPGEPPVEITAPMPPHMAATGFAV